MSDKDDFIYCLGIGPLHKPCHLRELCWRFKAMKGVRFHAPIQQKWHFCEIGNHTEKVHYWPLPAITPEMKTEKEWSNQSVSASTSTELQFAQLLQVANNMREELRQWNNGGALPYLNQCEVARIFNRCEKVVTLMIQELELNVDDGK